MPSGAGRYRRLSLSALVVLRKLSHLNLIGVLKAPE